MFDYDDNRDIPQEVTCPVCGAEFECSAREANAEAAPCCCEDCEHEWTREGGLCEQEYRGRMADLQYRCGYDYACGYHD